MPTEDQTPLPTEATTPQPTTAPAPLPPHAPTPLPTEATTPCYADSDCNDDNDVCINYFDDMSPLSICDFCSNIIAFISFNKSSKCTTDTCVNNTCSYEVTDVSDGCNQTPQPTTAEDQTPLPTEATTPLVDKRKSH